MRKLLLLLMVAAVAISASAAPVDMVTAQQKAQKFLNTQLSSTKLKAASQSAPMLVHRILNNGKVTEPAVYVYNTEDAFIVVAGDDRAEEILAYGDGKFNPKNVPDGLQYMLDLYAGEIGYLLDHPGLEVQPVASPQNSKELKAQSVNALCTAMWGQERPYNKQCVINDVQCVTGCPATSAAIVMYYWKYPTAATGKVPSYRTYLTSRNGSSYYTVSELPSTTFDWNNMRDTYGYSYTTAQGDAVATLMRYVGQKEQMDYGYDGSGISSTDHAKIPNMFKFFGYDDDCRSIEKTSYYGSTKYTDAQWAAVMQEELYAGRPMVFCGISGNYGHAFNVDGYDASNNKYHCNFGWDGYYNTWCAINSFGYSGEYYNSYQILVIGIQPPSGEPRLKLSTNVIDITSAVNESATATFTVKGYNLTGNVNCTISGGNGTFSVNPASISSVNAMNEQEVTVTYSPTAVGTNTATLTLSSNNCESQTITLNGTAKQPQVSVTSASLEMTTEIGSSIRKSFKITGHNVVGDLTITKTDPDNVFTLNSNVAEQSAIESTTGCTIYVTYEPTAIGSNHGSLTITGTGISPITVSLTGTCTGAKAITATPSTVDLATSVGTPATATFTVRGQNLSQSVRLTLNDETGAFKISPSVITASQAAAGKVVTVTYNPAAVGNHDATVSITGGGMASTESVTVTLSGVATEPVRSITANPNVLEMTAEVGKEATAQFVVTGLNLNGPLTLTTDNDDIFYVEPDYITASQAAAGKVVTVYYDPTIVGVQSGVITISGGGAPDASVVVTGVGTKPVHGYDRGDVDHDGTVSPSDISALIDYLLNGQQVCLECADVDDDGSVTPGDISALIDMLLNS